MTIWGAIPAAAQVSEYAVKAAFVYRFSEFVEWPPSSFKSGDSPITICVLGENPFGTSLQQMTSGKVFAGRHFAVKQLQDAALAPAACQLLFISRSEKARLRSVLTALGKAPVLTVGDTGGFAERGVMINLFLERGKVRFEINARAAERAGLQISSKLLSLAKLVSG